ncbi:hypothetical protein FB381_4223 [Nocardioides albertanoniae]|uniref:Uncharacterized protein n=1 Tax=Nocardioides albertanoniae TaxID=1175486 RepID=A0A543ACI6_9ACTN|nr:hypothetical protein [Nocardioides albertanoniae]TQL70293.1 hypothetical protein FB381_4223 [Nocardioides albertanoniae]
MIYTSRDATPPESPTLLWGADGAYLYATWLPRDENPSTIADRVQRLITANAPWVEHTQWRTTRNEPWPDERERRVELVAREVVRDDLGDAEPASGYSLMLTAAGERLRFSVQLTAGAPTSGRRAPSNSLTVEIKEAIPRTVTEVVAETVIRAVIESWTPLVAASRDEETLIKASRGGWSIPVGYRTWIADSVGQIDTSTGGIKSRLVAGGSYLTAPDAWDAEAVVDGMLRTFSANGLDKIRHT